jgi:chemotaxis protein MotB
MKHSGILSLRPQLRTRLLRGREPGPVSAPGAKNDPVAGARPRTGALGRASLVIVAISLLAGLTGCVSASSHREVVDERDDLQLQRSRLEEGVRRMEDSTQSLESERVVLLDQLEDLNIERDALRKRRTQLNDQVASLESNEVQLSGALAEREARLAAANEEMHKLKSTYTDLVSDLETEVTQGVIEIEQLRTGLRVGVADEILFASGSARIGSQGHDLLGKVAKRLGELDYLIDVTGHTDSIPISGVLTKRYPSNWELASARASSVVRLFRASGIDGGRLRVISRAQFNPVASNDDAEGRRENRRIDITLRPTESTEIPTARRTSPAQDEAASGSRQSAPPQPGPAREGGTEAGQPPSP